MTVIYGDTLFLLNAIMDYLLLLSSARVAGEPVHRGRLALGAALGGAYSVAVFMPGGAFLLHPVCKLASAVLMVLAGLGGSRRLLRQTIIFFALACGFGGGVLAITLLGGGGFGLGRGVVYSGMDLKIVLLSAAGCYAAMTVVFRRMGRHSAAKGELVSVRMTLLGRSVSVLALVDTGNTLTDPVSGRGVIVAEGACLGGIFPPGCGPGQADLTGPAAALARLSCGQLRGRFRLLPYRAVGVECGLLLAVRLDEAVIGGRKTGQTLVALSPTPVSDAGGYRALVGNL